MTSLRTVDIAGVVTVGVASSADLAEDVTVGVAPSADLAGDVTVGVASAADLAGDVTVSVASSGDLTGDVTFGVASSADLAVVATLSVVSSAHLAGVVTNVVASSADPAGDVTVGLLITKISALMINVTCHTTIGYTCMQIGLFLTTHLDVVWPTNLSGCRSSCPEAIPKVEDANPTVVSRCCYTWSRYVGSTACLRQPDTETAYGGWMNIQVYADISDWRTSMYRIPTGNWLQHYLIFPWFSRHKVKFPDHVKPQTALRQQTMIYFLKIFK